MTAVGVHPAASPAQRADFWADTCRDVTAMHGCARDALDLYRTYGCRFFEPGLDQVQNVLDALDGAAPGWESAHPELFYQTLELNYPQLVRHG